LLFRHCVAPLTDYAAVNDLVALAAVAEHFGKNK